MIKALQKTILRGVVFSSAMALAVSAFAGDDDKTTSTTSASSTDKHAAAFIKDASKDNEMEIALATLAKSKSQNSEVKSFAEHMLKDHTAAKQQMTTLASAHGVALPQAVEKTDKKLEKFEQMSASEFDKQFATIALKMHQKDIAKYEKAAQQVQASDVKSFITSNLPKLREHQQHAITVAQAVGVEQSTITALTKKMSDDAVGGTREGGLEESTNTTFEGSDEAGLKNQKGHGAHQLSEKHLDTK